MEFTVYHAARGHLPELVRELGDVACVREPLVAAPGPPRPAAWAQNVWLAPKWFSIASIGDGAKQLKAMQRNWAAVPSGLFRRTELIRQKLPKVSARPHVFGDPLPASPLGAWTLWDEKTILASPATSEPFPGGEYTFLENKTDPPSRAYLKLWEAFTRLGVRPAPGETCLDLGGSPGGWTWVLAECGARVVCVDKAPLDPRIAGLPSATFRRGSAFALDPSREPPVDWLFSDVVCYPARLLSLVKRWLESGKCRRFVCTIKFQGETDFQAMEAFRAIPGSRLLHLYNNKHELTWAYLGK